MTFPLHTPETLMKAMLDSGDSRELPVTTRHRDDMMPLAYRKGEVIVRAFSWVFEGGETRPERVARKVRTRKLITDWLERNEIPRDHVKIEGQEEPCEDYHFRFHAWAEALKPITLYVPPFDDEWWTEKKRKAGF